MSKSHSQDIVFSFVATLHNQQARVESMLTQLKSQADSLGRPAEFIFVDNGSQDDTSETLSRLASDDPAVKVVELSRRFDRMAAILAGCEYSCGQAVIVLAGGCQSPTDPIGELVARWREGFEVVYTTGRSAKTSSRLRRAVGRFFGLDVDGEDADAVEAAEVFLLDRKVADAASTVAATTGQSEGLLQHVGFRRASVPCDRKASAAAGSGKRRPGRLGVFDMSHTAPRPARIAVKLGAIALAAAAVALAACVLLWLTGSPPSSVVWVVAILVGISGVQMLLLAAMGCYLLRAMTSMHRHRPYVVRRTLGCDQQEHLGRDTASEPRKDREVTVSVYT